MGRRKIEIRAIKDDRNRSVTFLKRKGGLFKKAHELSVLCSVDVAVIIFGHNKKLYQFSSGDINETLRRYQYYGPPHEHKGPADFKNKSGGDDDDEDEEEDDTNMNREDSLPPQHAMMPPYPQHHSAFQHVRPPHPSASPPMPNGMFHRNSNTPQPPHMGSRPSSRNTIRRTSSNLVPMQHPHATPPPQQNGFAYAPNPPIYNPQANAPPPQPSPQPQYQPYPQHSTPQPHQQMQQPPQQQQQQAPQQQQQQQQQYISEPQKHTPPSQSEQFQPAPQVKARVSPPAQQQEFRQPEVTPPQIKHLPANAKSRSIFTPIDEGGSVLAHVFFGPPDTPRGGNEAVKKENSPEFKRHIRTAPPPASSRPTPPQPRPTSSLANEFRPPQRSDTNGSKSGARPKLNLTIPSEASDGEPTSNSPGHRSAVNSANPARPTNSNGSSEHHNNLILPPPSPSASAVLSAGASGPPNPFARPPPPTSQNNNAYNENRNNNLETPISALPSRYMDQDLLASPGGLFGAWANFGGSNTILPSPNVSTPLAERGGPAGFGRVDKREGDELVSDGKRIKT